MPTITLDDAQANLASIIAALAKGDELAITQGGEIVARLVGERSPRLPDDVQAQFDRLVKQWRRETAHVSSSRQLIQHAAYRAIIDMGKPAISLLLRELDLGLRASAGPDYWFSALRELSGENPVPETARGNVRLQAEHWLKWGKAHGY